MRGKMRWVAVVVPGLLAGALLTAAEPPPAGPSRPVSAPADSGHRLGYTGTARPALRVAVPGAPSRDLLAAADRGFADSDADVRDDAIVWVGQRGDADLGGDLYLRRRDGATVRLTRDAATERHPVLSPDGQRVAFTSDRSGQNDIWVVGADGSGLRRLTDHPADDTHPSWSPDGTRIVFASTRDDEAGDLHVLRVASGRTVRLTSSPAAETEPAWSPDGARIAFTTDRYGRTEVATVAAAGGPVSRPVPAPWDAAQPAWSPDGRRLALVTTRFDTGGDVYVLDGAVLTRVAGTAAAESRPAWRGREVVYTAETPAGDSDIWSADAAGQDRRNLTARPGLSEEAPAFSPDGTMIAYAAQQPEGGRRIVVADSDGRGPRILAPPGTRGGDDDSDPAWSPDGTQLAFTRSDADGSGRVLLLRVADAHLLGEVPMPPHLDGTDREPAWSPDGGRLALARSAQPRPSILDWPLIDVPVLPGGSAQHPQRVRTPQLPADPDIVFLVDNTSSMGRPGEGGSSVIEELKDRIHEVVDEVRAERPTAHFGLATFAGHLDPNVYDPRLPLTDDDAAIQRAVDGLLADSDYDDENWFYALCQIAQNDRIGFREGSSRVVVLIGDQYSVVQAEPDNTPILEETLVRELTTNEITFIGVPIVGTVIEDGLNSDGVAGRLAAVTGGRLTQESRPDQMIDAIKDALFMVDVSAVVLACDDGVDVSVTPAVARTRTGTKAEFREQINVAAGVAPGTLLRCTIRFTVDVHPPPGLQETQLLTVRVIDPALPYVRVDDPTVAAGGPQGAAVRFEATAADAGGRALTPDCSHRSGATFPVGTTLVTCTATDAAGRTGRDVATITVADGSTGGRIWTVGLVTARGPDGIAQSVTVTDQHDLSVRVGAPCATRTDDRAPAWSPDGASLAFTDGFGPDGESPPTPTPVTPGPPGTPDPSATPSAPSTPDPPTDPGTPSPTATPGGPIVIDAVPVPAERPGLCVTGADGSRSRVLLRAALRVADPAWSPDGRLIAVGLGDAAGSSIVTLPAGGGPLTTLVAGVGAQPTFQTLPTPDLRVSVTVSGQPGYVGGDAVEVTVTVRNTSRLPAAGSFLTLGIPPELRPGADFPAGCTATTARCDLGTLQVGQRRAITVRLSPRAAVDATVTARLGATVGGRTAARLARSPVLVLAPAVRVTPTIGPPGFVTEARGRDFPPGARVRLAWQPGVTATPDTVVVAADGTFRVHLLILRKDRLGPRDLTVTRVSGPRFAAVGTTEAFLVVPRSLTPPDFTGRN